MAAGRWLGRHADRARDAEEGHARLPASPQHSRRSRHTRRAAGRSAELPDAAAATLIKACAALHRCAAAWLPLWATDLGISHPRGRTCCQLVKCDLEEIAAGALVGEGLQLLVPVHILNLHLPLGSSKQGWKGLSTLVEACRCESGDKRNQLMRMQAGRSRAAHLVMQRHLESCSRRCRHRLQKIQGQGVSLLLLLLLLPAAPTQPPLALQENKGCPMIASAQFDTLRHSSAL